METQFKPGQSGNPAGRKTYGAYASEWMNSMATWTEEEVLKLIRNRKSEPGGQDCGGTTRPERDQWREVEQRGF